MTDQRTDVDVLSLEDFHATLAGRLQEAESLLTKLKNEMRSAPALGTFSDGKSTASRYELLHQQHVDRVRRLRAAVVAAEKATATIIANYKTTEARNRANATEIAAALSGVGTALNENGQAHV
ncbi:MAG TPA: hypothetical protein VFX61_01215 [Micromonosporaceae bacterium]|nr:hypothetical protein [Micromonosporaceae bacterium]